jgi:transposase-like protein
VIEVYLAGVSVRRVEDITEALWGTRVPSGTVSNLNKKIYAKIEEWRHRPIEATHPYLQLDGILAAARLRHIAGTQWSTRRNMNMDPLYAEQTSINGAVA